ncbi:MAG: hypothetical protein HKN61_07005 [Flavobacteriaceae bacterium]|nr:hypothetical protein [Flavobacteriaceae bacterium]
MSATRLLFFLLLSVLVDQVHAGITTVGSPYNQAVSEVFIKTAASEPGLDSRVFLHTNQLEVPEVREWEAVHLSVTASFYATTIKPAFLACEALYLISCRFISPSLGSTEIIFPFHFFP